MRVLTLVILAYTVAMLAVHVTSWKLVKAWYDSGARWAGRKLTPIRLLRVEAAYWTLAALAWPLCHSLILRVLVAAFAAIHLAGWLTGEMKRKRIDASLASGHAPRNLAVVVTSFDWVETLVLIALGWVAFSSALRR